MSNPTALIILDGWGISEFKAHNAIHSAETPHFDALWEANPHTTLVAHGEDVGMPEGVVGNSEVGHLALGAGRVIPHARVALDEAIASESLGMHPAWQKVVAHVKTHRSTLHIVTLLSTGGVHAHLSHLAAFLNLAYEAGVYQSLKVHGITDGRDMPTYTAMGLVEDVEGALYDLDAPQMATLSGRFYAMDRDKRWQRTEEAFNTLMHAKGKRQFMATQAVKFALADEISDEFIRPTVCDLTYEGMADGDAVLFLNFRPDRMAQLMEAFAAPAFTAFDRGSMPNNLHLASLVDYGAFPAVDVFFPKVCLTDTLAHTLANAGLTQFHIAETEKYPHVTYFFNGGQEAPLVGEERVLIPSRRDVHTYDEAPAMSVYEVARTLIQAFERKAHHFYVANLANIDMVAHTGNESATIEAVQHVDTALGLIAEAAKIAGITLVITADHGNGESMKTAEDLPNTAHTLNPVPLIVVPHGRVTASTFDMDMMHSLTDVRFLIESIICISSASLTFTNSSF
jgi:2,3-bisphosphoglycerate-independent phosphoglycerate mutase